MSPPILRTWRLVQQSFLFGDTIINVSESDVQDHDGVFEVKYGDGALLFLRKQTHQGVEGFSLQHPSLFLVNETFKTHPDLWTRIKNFFGYGK